MPHTVFIKNTAIECIASYIYNANSAQEAYTCAKRDWREDASFSVVTEPVYEYTFELKNEFGCVPKRVFWALMNLKRKCAHSRIASTALSLPETASNPIF